MQIQCPKCGEKGFRHKGFCPILAEYNARFKTRAGFTKEEFLGSSPAPFVGHYGYPFLNVGILSLDETKENAWEYDAPQHWAQNNYTIPEIINFRSSLINSRFKAHAHDRNKLLDLSQEIGMAQKPVDVEINLQQKPRFRLNTDTTLMPMGPNAQLKKAGLASNPKIHRKVEKVFSDTDLKANDALLYLYKNNFNENFLSRILSIGTIGMKKNRKLVPTKWSITATDDSIGKYLIEEIKQFNETDYAAYFGSYLGNYYLILAFPGPWTYELFETSAQKTKEVRFMTDYENFNPRKTYADNCAGGYYSVRLAILEKLKQIKRQGTILCLRFVTDDYATPLGVFVTREAARKAMNSKPITFSDQALMLKYAKVLINKKFGFSLDNLTKHSIILKNRKEQSRLTQFL